MLSVLRALRRLRGERGQILALAALGMSAFIGLSALTVDVGVGLSQRRAAQAAADAAALAGAVDIPGVTLSASQAITDATNTANTNLTDTNIKSPVVTVNTPPVSSTSCKNNHIGDTNSVQVLITATAPVLFAGVLKNALPLSIKVCAVATGNGSIGTPPIAILDPAAADSLDIGEDTGSSLSSKYQPSGGDTLDAGGNSVTVQVNGPVYTNSVADDGEEVHANYTLSATNNHVAGGNQILCDYSECGSYSPEPTAGDGTQLPDPLGYLSPPSTSTLGTYSGTGAASYCTAGPPPSCIVSGSKAVSVTPGVWKNLEVTSSGTLTLSSGTYVITGSLQLTGTQGSSNTGTASGTLTASGVTVYFTCPASAAPYWGSCPSGGGTAGSSGSTSCPNDCTGATTSSCPNKCSPGGFLNIQSGSGGTFTLTGPSSGSSQGLVVFYDRNNYVSRPGSDEDQETFNIEVIGSSNDTLNGTIYGERSNFWIVTKASTFTANSCIIVNSLGIYGPKNFTLSCSTSSNAIPSTIPYGGASLTE